MFTFLLLLPLIATLSNLAGSWFEILILPIETLVADNPRWRNNGVCQICDAVTCIERCEAETGGLQVLYLSSIYMIFISYICVKRTVAPELWFRLLIISAAFFLHFSEMCAVNVLN